MSLEHCEICKLEKITKVNFSFNACEDCLYKTLEIEHSFSHLKWISVEDRLPEITDIQYLVFIVNNETKNSYFSIRTFEKTREWDVGGRQYPTHWMPLPKVPE